MNYHKETRVEYHELLTITIDANDIFLHYLYNADLVLTCSQSKNKLYFVLQLKSRRTRETIETRNKTKKLFPHFLLTRNMSSKIRLNVYHLKYICFLKIHGFKKAFFLQKYGDLKKVMFSPQSLCRVQLGCWFNKIKIKFKNHSKRQKLVCQSLSKQVQQKPFFFSLKT